MSAQLAAYGIEVQCAHEVMRSKAGDVLDAALQRATVEAEALAEVRDGSRRVRILENQLAELIDGARRMGCSGVALKDDSDKLPETPYRAASQ